MASKRSLVMSGGGAKGAFQVGVLNRLQTQFDAVYGTSTGALNAAGLAFVPERKNEVWDSIRRISDVYALQWWTLGPIFGAGIYSYSPLEKILENTILGKTALMDITVTKVDIKTGTLVYDTRRKGEICDSDFLKSVLASTSVPLHANPVDGRWYDGGVREITPLKRAISDGATEITVIMTNPYKQDPNLDPSLPGVLFRGIRLGLRSIDIISHEIYVSDLKVFGLKNEIAGYKTIPLTVLAPPVLLLGTDSFTQTEIQAAKAQGEFTPLEQLRVEKLCSKDQS